MESHREEKAPLLSVVIPSFNEGLQLGNFLMDIQNYLDSRDFKSEVLVIDDASTDTSEALLREFAGVQPFRIFRNSENQGKGYSVRRGILASQGDYILILDADGAYRISALDDFLAPLRTGAHDIALGNRRIHQSRFVLQPKYLPYVYVRHLTGVMFNLIARSSVLPGFTDTQCGYKCFSRKAAMDIFKRLRIPGFCFEVEALAIAVRRGYRCIDIPVTFYYCGEPSSIRVFPHALYFLRDIFLIRRNMMLGVYDD